MPLKSWDDALRRPDRPDLLSSLAADFAEYVGVDPAAGREAILRQDYNDAFLQEWKARSLAPDQRGVVDFFGKSPLFLATNLRAAHSRFIVDVREEVLALALREGFRAALDYGGGVGNTALLFQANGVPCTLGEISDELLAFARWRAERRDLPFAGINLLTEPLPPAGFDLVTAFASFEQIADVRPVLDGISAALRPGGMFALFVSFGLDSSSRPWNIGGFPEYLFTLRRTHPFALERLREHQGHLHAWFRRTDRPASGLAGRIADRMRSKWYQWKRSRLIARGAG